MQLEDPPEFDDVKTYFFKPDGTHTEESDSSWTWGKIIWTLRGEDVQRVTFTRNADEEFSEATHPIGYSPAKLRPEDGDLKQDLPASAAFSDIGNNIHIVQPEELLIKADDAAEQRTANQENKKLGKYFDEKSDTGDDHSRTGPGGNLPDDNYDPKIYAGESDTKIHIATPIQERFPDRAVIHGVDGTPPEIKEGVYPPQDREISFEHPSTFVGTTTYTPETQTLEISLSGRKYGFCNVPQRVYEAFEAAPSKGEFFNRNIKKLFNCAGFSESLNIYRDKAPNEFDWIGEEAMANMKEYAQKNGKGRFLLVVASGETITDHRPEGKERHRRKWSEGELIQNIRSAKGKLIDINHYWKKTDPYSGAIYDANWNFKTRRGEMMLWETDQAILDAIRQNKITAVSINTGKARKVVTECSTGECFIEPQGTQLGEHNGVALAYVVTDPAGLMYNGEWIPPMPPGMQFTKIYIVE